MNNGQTTPQLRVSELYRKRETRDSARLRAYNKILETIHHRIRTMSQLPHSPCNLLYTIPPFILGLPKIDLEDCVVYLVYQLRMTGLVVRYTFPNLLYIDWSHHERSYILEQSPIMQAMLDAEEVHKDAERRAVVSRRTVVQRVAGTAEPSSNKKKVSFATTDLGAPSVGRAPSAAEYIPPANFIKQMSEPGKNGGTTDPLAALWSEGGK
jgi:hypothetical protein